MFLNQRDCLLHHFLFTGTSFIANIGSVVLVKPNPAIALLVNRDHCLGDVEAPKTIVQALKSDDALLEEIERLAQVEAEDLGEFNGAVLIVDFQLDQVGRLIGVRIYLDMEGLGNGELGLTSPLVNFQIGEEFGLG